jgi:hypothetical protein
MQGMNMIEAINLTHLPQKSMTCNQTKSESVL